MTADRFEAVRKAIWSGGEPTCTIDVHLLDDLMSAHDRLIEDHALVLAERDALREACDAAETRLMRHHECGATECVGVLKQLRAALALGEGGGA